MIDIGRLSPVVRTVAFAGLPSVSSMLAVRIPSLLNQPGGNFDESMPLRGQAPVTAPAAGAMAIQQFFENMEWAMQSGDPVAYAPHLRRAPLRGSGGARPILFQFARGDQSTPNPTSTAFLRAGALADRATYFRHDLVLAALPNAPRDPHLFQLRIITPPFMSPFAVAAQQQAATFFASDGTLIVDPDGAAPVFETPVALPLPEDLNYTP